MSARRPTIRNERHGMTSPFPFRALHVFLLASSLTIVSAHAADPGNTLHVAFPVAETSFDPAFASDAASDGILANIMEAMLDYDYLARPVKLVPRTLEAMPLVEENGQTYTMKVRKGILFTPYPAAKVKLRELRATDRSSGLQLM